jgi:hypothetical protein
MKYTVPFVLCVVGITGCVRPETQVSLSPRDTVNPLSILEVGEVQQTLRHLKAGMTMQDVLESLRKTPFEHAVGSVSGGPTNDRYTIYQLRQGVNLVLRFDYTRSSPLLVAAEQAGDAWPKNPEQRSSNHTSVSVNQQTGCRNRQGERWIRK